jgi:dienelactone hydrolase
MSPLSPSGSLPSGSRYQIEVPDPWNGDLLLYSLPIPVEPGQPPWPPGDGLIDDLTGQGYAVAGAANTIFWPVESSLTNLPPLLDAFRAAAGTPRRTISLGLSIGGLITAAIVERYPGLLSGALPMCGNLAGAVAVHDRELDIAFVVKTLLAPDSGLTLADIADPEANLELATKVLAEAQATPVGRARLALAAAVGNIPGWHEPGSPEPDSADYEGRLRNQIAWFEEPGFLVYFWAREQVERQAGGNPSSNTGTDYRWLLETSIGQDQVSALYDAAGLSLEADLETLAAAPRIAADPEAVAYLERNIVFSGELGGVPVLTMHTDGDGLVTPDNQHAYADVVRAAGNDALLRQVFVHRAGHCSFTPAEVSAGLKALVERIDTGEWPDLEPATLNAQAHALGPERQGLRSGATSEPGFFAYQPRPFPRAYDMRDAGRRVGADGAGPR